MPKKITSNYILVLKNITNSINIPEIYTTKTKDVNKQEIDLGRNY